MCLKVWAKLLGCHTYDNAACSRWEYQVFVYARDLIIKNIGLCFWFSSSLKKVVLTETSDTAK